MNVRIIDPVAILEGAVVAPFNANELVVVPDSGGPARPEYGLWLARRVAQAQKATKPALKRRNVPKGHRRGKKTPRSFRWGVL